MHWVLWERIKAQEKAASGSFGPTDPTRAMLPFLFAASAVQAGDSVTLMLFHDAVLMAVDGVGRTLVPVGPPDRLRRATGARHERVGMVTCCLEFQGNTALARPSRHHSTSPCSVGALRFLFHL
jgi:hypothetical protein